MDGVCPCGCNTAGLTKRTVRRHMNRLRGPARYGRPRAARPPSPEPPPELRIPGAEPADLDPARPEGAEDPGANVESEDEEDELVEPPVDAGVADASIPCRAQRALDEARSRDRDPPVARGGHVSALVALLITAVLSIRFSFTNVATSTVLEFVGAVLPDGNFAPCGNMYDQFVLNGPAATKFDMCEKECVVYRDAHWLSDPTREFRLLDAARCPACQTPRLDPVTGKPAHVPAYRTR